METQQLEKLIRDIKVAKLRKYTTQKFKYFVPTGVGEEFISLVGSGKHFVVLLSAANGIGKTWLAVNLVANICFPGSNKYFNYPLFRDFPFPKRGRIISTPTAIEQTIIPELHNWFPKGRYEARKMRKMYDSYWRTNTGWSFDVMTYEQDVGEFESSTLGWAWFDEPPPQSVFKATVARMRKGGIIFITATPLTGSAWMYDHIIATPSDDVKKLGNTTYLEADVGTACIEHGVRGFLRHRDIENMISQYDEEDLQARVKGKFQHLIGLIFKMFSRRIHVIKPFPITREDFVVAHALDPHPRNPDAVNWMAVDRKGRKFIVNELYERNKISELAESIKRRDENYRMVLRIADPAAFVDDQHEETGMTLAQKLEKAGVAYIKATKDRTTANRAIGDALNYQLVGTEMLKAPELYIFDTCPRTIWEFEHYRWGEWLGRAGELKNPKEEPVDKDDHTIENIGRLLLQNVRFTELPRTRPTRRPFTSTNPFQGSG